MKRYMIHERGRGFEFQTNYDMNTEEFWNDLQHYRDCCVNGEYFHIPPKIEHIISITTTIQSNTRTESMSCVHVSRIEPLE